MAENTGFGTGTKEDPKVKQGDGGIGMNSGVKSARQIETEEAEKREEAAIKAMKADQAKQLEAAEANAKKPSPADPVVTEGDAS